MPVRLRIFAAGVFSAPNRFQMVSDLSAVLEFLAVDAVSRPRYGIEAALQDLGIALDANTECTCLHSIEREVDEAYYVPFFRGQLVAQITNHGRQGAVSEVRRFFAGAFLFTVARLSNKV